MKIIGYEKINKEGIPLIFDRKFPCFNKKKTGLRS